MNARMLVACLILTLISVSAGAAAQANREGPEPARAAGKIEGHWTLAIRDENGTVASVHTFDNHFEGRHTLLALLLGNSKTKAWALDLRIDDGGVTGGLCLSPPPAQVIECTSRQIGFEPS